MILYLSFFTPPKTELDAVPNFDKLVHFCMYFGFSGVIWLESLCVRRNKFGIRKILVAAVLFPVLFSGCIEVGQEYLTINRSGDWIDFVANATGVVCASLIAYYIVRPRMNQKDI